MVTVPEVYFSLVRGEQAGIGGVLRLRPSRRQVVQANRALGAQSGGSSNSLLPTVLDEEKGQVPLFYSERVSFEDANGVPSFPFFLVKEDLDAAYEELQARAAPSAPPSKSKGEAGIPIGLTRIATLDGLVDQMTRGDIDLSQVRPTPTPPAPRPPLFPHGGRTWSQLPADVCSEPGAHTKAPRGRAGMRAAISIRNCPRPQRRLCQYSARLTMLSPRPAPRVCARRQSWSAPKMRCARCASL